jgi:mono/diheme cytochrome c family protein
MPGNYTKVVYTPAGHIVFIEKQLKVSVSVLFYFQNWVKRNLVKKTMMTRTLLLTLTLFTCMLLAGFRSNNNPSESSGQKLYEKHCMRCHGKDGTKGSFGAKNLRQSILPDVAIIQQIEKGKGFMPPFRKKLTVNEMAEIMLYIKSLRIKE